MTFGDNIYMSGTVLNTEHLVSLLIHQQLYEVSTINISSFLKNEVT